MANYLKLQIHSVLEAPIAQHASTARKLEALRVEEFRWSSPSLSASAALPLKNCR